MKFSGTEAGTTMAVRVIPRAQKNAIQGALGDALKIRLCAPPVEGAANAALVEFLAEALGIARGKVRILSGATGRNKRVWVEGLGPDEVSRRLNV